MRNVLKVILFVILILILAWLAWNFARPEGTDIAPAEPGIDELEITPEVEAAYEDFKTAHKNATFQWSRKTATPRVIYNFRAGPFAGTLEEQGRRFLSRWAALLKLRPDLRDLYLEKSEPGIIRKPVVTEQPVAEQQEVESSPVLHYLTFAQRFQKLPVYGAQIILYISRDAEVVTVHNSYYPDPQPGNVREIDRKSALTTAAEALRGEETFGDHSDASLIIFPYEGTFYYAWDVRLKGWQVVVDAETGAVLYKRKRVMTQTAFIYTENCDTTPTRQWRPMTALDTSGFLRGTFYRVDPAQSSDPIAQNATRTYNYPVNDTRFEQVMVYYFLEEARRYFFPLGYQAIYPGGTTTPPVITALTNYNYTCNAWYDPDEVEWVFGRAGTVSGCDEDFHCESPAHDGNVIMHEYTHWVIDQVSGIDYSGEGAAIHEGTADYFSNSYADNPCAAECFDDDNPCLRNLDNSLHYPGDMTGEGHDDGRIWGGALWDLRELVGEAWIDEVIFAALQGLPFHPSFSDYARNVYMQSLIKAQDVFDLSNFIEALLAGIIQYGIHDAFCQRGIIVPYGDFVTRTVELTNCWFGESETWTIDVPAGHTIRAIGCGSFRNFPSDQRKGYDERIHDFKNVDSYSVSVQDNRVTISVELENAFMCINRGKFRATYWVYYE